MKKLYNFRADPADMEELNRLCLKLDSNVSREIRGMIRKFVSQQYTKHYVQGRSHERREESTPSDF